MNKRLIGRLLASIGIENAVRSAWYRVMGRRIIKSVSLGNQRCSFHCPIPMLSDSIAEANKERPVLEWFLNRLREGDMVWDIGSNIGLWTVFAAKRAGASGKVLAFDPFADAVRLLKANLVLNGVTNVIVRAEALGERDGRLPLYPAKADVFTTSSLTPRSGVFGTETQPTYVPVRAGAGIVRDDPSLVPDAMKLDVEGAEQAVLEGFSGEVWSRLHTLVIEVHPEFLPSMGGSVEEVRRIISERGMKVAGESTRRNTMHWLCCNDSIHSASEGKPRQAP